MQQGVGLPPGVPGRIVEAVVDAVVGLGRGASQDCVGLCHSPPRYDRFSILLRLSAEIEADAAATPIIKEAVETIVSSEPGTAARNQPARPLRGDSRCLRE